MLVVGGKDRLRFLNAVIAQDVAGLVPGEGAFCALTDERGGPIAAFQLYVLPEAILLELPERHAEVARDTLERLIVLDEVMTEWAAGETVAYEACNVLELAMRLGPPRPGRLEPPALWFVEPGPGVYYADVASGVYVDDPDALALVPMRRQAVLRASRFGGFGALRWADKDRLSELREFVNRGNSMGRLFVTADERSPLEIEGGIVGDAELTEARVWNELDLMDAVSLTKGCWMGQEIVRRVHVLGEVKRRRMGVFLDTPNGKGWAGADLVTEDGAPAGIVTRAARSASLGRTIAQAFVAQAGWTPGTVLTAVRLRDGLRERAETAKLPFLERMPHVEPL